MHSQINVTPGHPCALRMLLGALPRVLSSGQDPRPTTVLREATALPLPVCLGISTPQHSCGVKPKSTMARSDLNFHMQVMPSIHNKIALGGWEQCGNAHFVGHSSWRSARRKISSGTTIGIVHAHFVGRSKIDLTSISDPKMFGMCRIQYGKEISYLYPTKKYVVSVG